ncbi:DNA sulfur modification protein DndB [bacterium]|nr:DNA sulfur modification protein DndB [bacterium]
MGSQDNVLTFSAIRGVQAGREYYGAMCPLRVVAKFFVFDEEEVGAKLRAQRSINRSRVPELTRYIVENPKDYIFSSITASVDGKVVFKPFGEKGAGRNLGLLSVPMTARFLVNDGQHRRAAIEEAVKERPELGDETISVVFFHDAGLKRSQQMFSDLNRHAIRPTKSLGILYDHRDPLSQLARHVVDEVSFFGSLTETEKTTISNRSNKLHTLSSVYQATRTFLGKSKRSKVSDADKELAVSFWEETGKMIPDWGLAVDKKVACAELRRDFIHAHGIALQALGGMGAALLAEEPKAWKRRLKPIAKVDWSRTNGDAWEGRALMRGKISKALTNVVLTTNYLKKQLGLALSAAEQQQESKFQQYEALQR